MGNFGEQHLITEDVEDIKYLHTADMDGDGDLDVLCSNFGFEIKKIAWYENVNPTELFTTHLLETTFNLEAADSVFPADMDNDGDIDLVVDFHLAEKIVWYKNLDGKGDMGNPIVISGEPIYISRLMVADLDNDGYKDVICYHRIDASLFWYKNLDGQGNFSAKKYLPGSNLIGPMDIGDLDGDNDLDILVSFRIVNAPNKIAWLENLDGQGNFAPLKFLPSNWSEIRSLFLADVDNDGDPDIFCSSFVEDRMIWHKNDGQANFGKENKVFSSVIYVRNLLIEDFDGDSDLDIVSSSANSTNQLAFYENTDGEGNYGDQQLIDNLETGGSVAFAIDLDKDNDLDLLSQSAYQGIVNIVWHENTDGSANFGAQQILTNQTSDKNTIFPADLNQDNKEDIIGADFEQGLSWCKNMGLAVPLGNPQNINENVEDIRSVFSADLDGDGDLDILSGSAFNRGTFWYENLDGNGTFSDEKLISQMKTAESVYADDLDGDGDLDVMICASGENKVAWFENLDGNGSFGPAKIINAVAIDPTVIRTADLDGDGDLEVVFAATGNQQIIWHENLNGKGAFGKPNILAEGGYFINTLVPKDIDGDGDIDVVATYENHIFWYENTGLANNKLDGNIWLDVNNNGCSDMLAGVPNIRIKADDGTAEISTFTQSNGTFQFFVEEGDFTIKPNPLFPFQSSPDSINLSFTGLGQVESTDFCFSTSQQINDLEVVLLPPQEARPGFDLNYNIVYNNKGTTRLSGTLEMSYDPKQLLIQSSSQDPITFTDSTLIYEYTDLAPFETRAINLSCQVLPPPMVGLNDTLCTAITISPTNEEHTISDNTFELKQETVNSFDPNDITVLEGAQIPLDQVDDYLHYLIRFQNTGTAEAINVSVVNPLGDQLDVSSLQLIESSHQNRVEIKNGNELSFVFDLIFLADSTTNEAASHGFIAYKIKPQSHLNIGDIIYNSADIYFDFNLPITTNTVSTEIVDFLDKDNDGYLSDVDCDDNNPRVNPGIKELPYDGLDNDCDSLTLDDDLDQDGFLLANDCNDEDSSINPDAVEIPDNGIDEDCDGEDLVTGTHTLAATTVLISPNPTLGNLQIRSTKAINGRVQVTDYLGNVILEKEIVQNLDIDLSSASNGLYFITIKTENWFIIEKLLKL